LAVLITADESCAYAQAKMASNSNEIRRDLQAETTAKAANPMFFSTKKAQHNVGLFYKTNSN